MKSFDDIFKENVEKIFSDYKADHLADQGWNSFVAAGKGKRKLRATIPLWARAASIALFIATGALITFLVMNRKLTEDGLISSVTEQEKEIAVSVHSRSEGSISPITDETIRPLLDESTEPVIDKTTKHPLDETTESVLDEITEALLDENTEPLIKGTKEPLKRNGEAGYPENRSLLQGDSINLAFEEALKEFIEEENKESATDEAEKRSGRTALMAGMSGLLAHVQDAASTAPGVSLGFYLEQKITDKISVRPGLALALNTLGVDNGSTSYDVAYSVPLIDGNSGTLDSYSGTLSMLAMELPLNVVFKVYEKGRSGIYLSAGTSTMIYISQQYTGDYINEYTQKFLDAETGSVSSETRYSTVTVDNDYGAFSRTDFFGLANFSAGYTIPWSKTGTMLIEPFVQLPLSDLTALDLRVRYGGVSLKIRFGSHQSQK